MFGQCCKMCPVFNFISVSLTKFYYLHEVLFWKNRTCAINNFSCLRFDKVQALLKYKLLNFRNFMKAIYRKFPAKIRITPHYSSSSTRYI